MLQKGLLKEHAAVLSWIAKFVDIGLFALAGFLAYHLQFHHLHLGFLYQIAFLLAILLLLPIFSIFGIYKSIRSTNLINYLFKVGSAIIILMLILAAITFMTKTGPVFSRAWYLMWGILAVIFLCGFRIVLYGLLRLMRKQGWNQRNILIIGAGAIGQDLVKYINGALWSGLKVVGILDDDPAKNAVMPNNLAEYIEQSGVDEVWLALPLRVAGRIENIIENLRHNMVTIRYFPDMFGLNLLNHSTSEVFGFSAINIVSSPMVGINRFVKAIEDRILAFLILALISPVFFTISILVKLSSPGSIFYRQERTGWNGKNFNMLKFRSMPINAEENTGAVWAAKGEKRATKIGAFLRKTSLDELPQFINVLKGDMSIVGPRPERPIFVAQFKDEIKNYMRKHLVKGGITGWAQINGWRGNTSLEKRIEYDLYYIENWSLWFDLKIIFFTLFKGFIHKNAY